MKQNIDNPAGRLHLVLNATQRFSSQEAASRVTARDVWSQALGIEDKSDTVAIYRGLGLLLEQAEKAEKLIREMPDVDHGLYLSNFPLLKKGIATPGIDGGWSNQFAYLTPVVLRDLAFCASKIAEWYSDGIIEGEELARLSQEISLLFDEVRQAPIDPDLRELLLDLLETMRRAVAEYSIRGAAGVKEALSKGIGVIVITRHQADKPAEKTVLKKLLDLLAKTDVVVGRATKYKPILTSIVQKLLPEAGGIEGGGP